MYAIIEDSGVQIKVSQGDVIRVDERPLPAGTGSITFERVLLVGGAEGGGEARIGRPYVEGAKVTAEVLG
ncbi:MAG TPA: 50S ribosomal protein L21, partial [Phycisphaeraceae bacterium]